MLDFRRIKSLGITKESGITRVDKGLAWPVFTMEKHPGMRSQIKYIFVEVATRLVSTGDQDMLL